MAISSQVLYPLACGVAGLCAGLFGIGGGIIKGPLMLEMGISPQVASATSAFMILFTAASATFQYAMLGDLRPAYATVLFIAGGSMTMLTRIPAHGDPRPRARIATSTLLALTLSPLCSGLAGTVVGQLVLGALMRRWGRQSIIVLLIAAIIGG